MSVLSGDVNTIHCRVPFSALGKSGQGASRSRANKPEPWRMLRRWTPTSYLWPSGFNHGSNLLAASLRRRRTFVQRCESVSVRAPLTARLLLRLPARCSEPGPVEWPPQFQPTTTSTCIASHAAWRAKLHWVPVLQDSAPMVPKPDLRGRCAEFGTQWMEVWSALGERPQPELSAPAARSPHNPFPL